MLPRSAASGLLLAAAGVPWGVVDGGSQRLFESPPGLLAAAAALTALLMLAGLTIVRRPELGRSAATLSVAGVFALAGPHLLTSPSYALVALIAGAVFLYSLWPIGPNLLHPLPAPYQPSPARRAQGAALAAVGLWLVEAFLDPRHTAVQTGVVAWSLALACGLGLAWARRNLRLHRFRVAGYAGALGVAVPLALVLWRDWWAMTSVFAAPALVVALMVRHPAREEQKSWQDSLIGRAERLFVGTFVALCLLGTVLLAHPQSAASGQSIGLADAAFTSASAVFVTGLIVLDTPVDFSGTGQLVILLLIQVGGVGIMTFSTALLWALGRRMSMRHEGAVARLLHTQNHGPLFATVKRIIQLTAIVEGAGAILLFLAFLGQGDTLATAAWRGIFTSISAFCNAGFALQSDSLIPYQHAPLILHTVAALIIVGGLSPLVVFSLPRLVRQPSAPVPAQVRLALVTAGALLLGGFLFTLAFEWSDSLAGLGVQDKLHNAWFQSVTLRTAGFTSVDLTRTRSATLALMLLWMFIGGSPGGTAGGVKTTTVAVLVLSVSEAIRGQWTLEAFGKHIPERTRAKSLVVVTIAVATALGALVVLLLTQTMSANLALFEIVSALGTVGLSIGGTRELDGVGKGIVILCMFVGRVGGLTLLIFLSSRRASSPLGRPEEEIDVG